MEFSIKPIVHFWCDGVGEGENGQVESGRIVFVVEGLDVVIWIDLEAEPFVKTQTTCSKVVGDLFDFEDDGSVCR